MPGPVQVLAKLLVRAGLTDRQLNVDDFKIDATGAAKEATLALVNQDVADLLAAVVNAGGLQELLAAIGANTDGLEGKFDTLNGKDFSTAARQDAAKVIAEAIRDRIGSYGVGVPEEGTTNALLRKVVAAVESIAIDSESITIDADTINLSTDQVESLLEAIGGAIGTTADPETLNTLIGRTKRLVTVASTLATEQTLSDTKAVIDYRYSGGKTPVVATVTASGDTVIHTPASGKRIRLFWVSAINDPAASASPLIKIKLGGEEKYRVYATAHWEVFDGPVDGELVVNLDVPDGSVAVTAHLQEID